MCTLKVEHNNETKAKYSANIIQNSTLKENDDKEKHFWCTLICTLKTLSGLCNFILQGINNGVN